MRAQEIPEGPISPDSEAGKAIGFTRDLFDGYLWCVDGTIYISVIFSHDEGKGHLRALFDRIEAAGFRLKVPTPFARMQKILERRGMKPTEEKTDMGPCEVWVKP